MSRFRPDLSKPSRFETVSVWALLAMNLALLGMALAQGDVAVVDGDIEVTDGWTVAVGIALTLVVAGLAFLLPFRRRLVRRAQIFALGAQVLHAGGHLFRLYYLFPVYDDVLHFGLAFLLGLLAFDFARSRRFVFNWRLGPARVAILVWIASTALAGLWEIFEFSADVLAATREQDDLTDTMVDMIDGTLGGAAAGFVAWRGLRAERRAQRLADARSDELLD